MNILLVSQCQKNALKETRRILDQFAERCGDRVWQTPITQAGLSTLKAMLRRTARKNTAVACYWTHGKNLTELLWIVGDQSQFNAQGRVPTQRTKRNILRSADEGGWLYGYSLQILVGLAALLHDLGKASVGFQNKLQPESSSDADPYRHEWVSVRLFEAMIHGCKTDQAWLQRLANWAEQGKNEDLFKKIKKEVSGTNLDGFRDKPPLAQVLIWLIATHHRGVYLAEFKSEPTAYQYVWRTVTECLRQFYNQLSATDGWVRNSKSEHPKPKQFWAFETLASDSPKWQKAMARWAKKALNHLPLMQLSQQLSKQPAPLNNPFLLLTARLTLMSADYYYSSLPPQPLGQDHFPLLANTDSKGQPKQRLDEHLIGVANSAVKWARLLPRIKTLLPALKKHKSFVKRTSDSRYVWQNRAFDLARSLAERTVEQGFFGVNMASTGCGKTLANARVMYGLADRSEGARFTIALGLRVLTLQTGESLKNRLGLEDDQLAVLVGGSATRTLFNLQKETQNILGKGSESLLSDLDDWRCGSGKVSENAVDDLPELATLLVDQKAKELLYTPIVSCTIDHLIQASECLRGGKHIVPTLRLLTGDLILDEPDDFDQRDLPALSRLVHLAGLFGSRVLLSSATLTPDLIGGLFEAYQAGWQIWQSNNGITPSPVCCAWFDEFQTQSAFCLEKQRFEQEHQQFVEQRVKKLAAQPVRRQATVLSLEGLKEGHLDWSVLAEHLLQQAVDFHQLFATRDPLSNKKVSLGLIRFANIRPIIATIQAMLECLMKDENIQIHLCCYHSHQLQLLRSRLESRLDSILNRTDPTAIFSHPDIARVMANSPAENHLFIVVGSPVTEVGRDHDYDWAIVDPSSMRSIIQLAGRVWRHRSEKVAEQPNIALLPSNWRGLGKRAVNEPIFHRPGFETKACRLSSHLTEKIISQDDLASVTAIPRIVKPEQVNMASSSVGSLRELEHRVMATMFDSSDINYVNGYWRTEIGQLTVHHPRISPFRQSLPTEDIVCLPSDDRELGYKICVKDKSKPDIHLWNDEAHRIIYKEWEKTAANIHPWLVSSLSQSLDDLAEYLGETDLTQVALNYATVSLPNTEAHQQQIWYYNEFFGFWQEDN